MKFKFNNMLSITLMMVMATFHTAVNSETVCNGLIETNCSANASCTWVNGYVTKKGNQVNGWRSIYI